MNEDREERGSLENRNRSTRQGRWHPPWNTWLTSVSLSVMGPFRRLFEPPARLIKPYVKKSQVVADLGCGPGYYTLPLADWVGPEGRVYAVDFDKRSIRALTRKAAKSRRHNVEPHVASASDLSFIRDRSVDFILANGLL